MASLVTTNSIPSGLIPCYLPERPASWHFRILLVSLAPSQRSEQPRNLEIISYPGSLRFFGNNHLSPSLCAVMCWGPPVIGSLVPMVIRVGQRGRSPLELRLVLHCVNGNGRAIALERGLGGLTLRMVQTSDRACPPNTNDVHAYTIGSETWPQPHGMGAEPANGSTQSTEKLWSLFSALTWRRPSGSISGKGGSGERKPIGCYPADIML